jgi:hypothetical protein
VPLLALLGLQIRSMSWGTISVRVLLAYLLGPAFSTDLEMPSCSFLALTSFSRVDNAVEVLAVAVPLVSPTAVAELCVSCGVS